MGKVFMRKVVVDNEYDGDGDGAGDGDDEGQDDNILGAPQRYCPRDRRFTPLQRRVKFLHFYSASLDRCLLSIFLLAPDFQDFN